MNGIKQIIILLVTLSIAPFSLSAQNYVKQTFTKHLNQEKSAGKVYLVKTGYTTTSLVVSIGRSDDFSGAYVIVGNDTSFLKTDEDTEPDEINLFSNLLTFNTPIDSFYFYPGKIQGEITFYFINASSKKESPAVYLLKKKVQTVLFRTWSTSRSGGLVCRCPITKGSINKYLI